MDNVIELDTYALSFTQTSHQLAGLVSFDIAAAFPLPRPLVAHEGAAQVQSAEAHEEHHQGALQRE